MPELLLMVVDNPDLVDDVLQAWLAAGVAGITLLDSAGLGHRLAGGGEDLPLFPSLSNLLRAREEVHRTLFAVVRDGFDVEALVEATQKITGDLSRPNTGILLTLPVTRVWGLHRRNPAGA